MKLCAVSSSKGVQKNKNNARQILKELSIIPITKSSFLAFIVCHADDSFENKVGVKLCLNK